MIEALPAGRVFKRRVCLYDQKLAEITATSEGSGAEIEFGPVYVSDGDCGPINCNYRWGNNYFHWLYQVASDILFAKHYLGESLRNLYVFQDSMRGVKFFKETLEACGVACFYAAPLNVTPSNAVTFITSFRETAEVHPWLVQEWRQRLIPKARLAFPCRDGDRLLIQRNVGLGSGPQHSRNIENRDEIMEVFAKAGLPLQMVFLEGMPLLEQVAMFSHASLVIGVHGAGMTNITFCKPTAIVVEIVSPIVHQNSYWDIASQIGFPFAALLGKAHHLNGDTTNIFEHYLHVKAESLLRLVDKLVCRP